MVKNWYQKWQKDKLNCSVKELTIKCSEMLNKFKKHIFNIWHQYAQYRFLKESLNANECTLHIDFTENYSCKYFEEIQSVHFGASHAQATLHNAVCYLTDSAKNLKTVTFCSVSDSRSHDPPAIWVYLNPVLTYIWSAHPEINTVHFFSDGPCTQYWQKLNFFFLSTKLWHGFSGRDVEFFRIRARKRCSWWYEWCRPEIRWQDG